MFINQKRIVTAKHLMEKIPNIHKFKVVHNLKNIDTNLLTKIGYLLPMESGSKILPNILGPISKFNANGKYIPLKHLPKENRFLYQIEWTWTEFHGDKEVEQSDFKDIYRLCYQRDFIPPPSVEFTYMEYNGESLIVSDELVNDENNYDNIKHIINLFLEIFGECELKYSDLENIIPPAIKKVNWTMLPPGEYPWLRENTYIYDMLSKKAPRTANPIIARQNEINSFKPDEIYQGAGGFRAYIAYVFKEKGVTVLESTQIDNATYLFNLNWEQTSQLTKAQILQNNLHIDRIIHSKGWLKKLGKYLK